MHIFNNYGYWFRMLSKCYMRDFLVVVLNQNYKVSPVMDSKPRPNSWRIRSLLVLTLLPLHMGMFFFLSSYFLHTKWYARWKQPSIKYSRSGGVESGGKCVIPLSWCQSVFDGWVMAEWLSRWPLLWVAKYVSEIHGSWIRNPTQCTDIYSNASHIENKGSQQLK